MVRNRLIILVQTFRNTARYLTKSKHYGTLLHKLFERFTEIGRDESRISTSWALDNVSSLSDWLEVLDKTIWQETIEATSQIRLQCEQSLLPLRKEGLELGGGGAIELLYFMTRLTKPETILETGVAAGWSSYAFLSAMKENGLGTLLSSDLPYFRIRDPERYVGIVVPQSLRSSNWVLMLNGDRKNLKSFLDERIEINLTHYDSDKRKIARRQFFKMMEHNLAKDSILIMDDIQNNLAFKEHVESNQLKYRVIESEGKFVGIILKGKYALNGFVIS